MLLPLGGLFIVRIPTLMGLRVSPTLQVLILGSQPDGSNDNQ